MLFVPKSNAKTVIPINNAQLDQQSYAHQCQATDWLRTNADRMANQTEFVPSQAQPAKNREQSLVLTDSAPNWHNLR